MPRLQNETYERRGDLQQTPLCHLLLLLDRARFSGTLVLLAEGADGSEVPDAWVRLVEGSPVAADLTGVRAPSLFAGLLELCERSGGGFECMQGEDLVGSERAVLRGHVDVHMLAATSLRQAPREAIIDGVLQGLRTGVLQIKWDCSFSRFGLTRDEWKFVQELRRMGGRLDDLLARSELPREAARHMVYLLHVTGLLVRLPANRRLESQDVSILNPATIDEALQAYVAEDPTVICNFAELGRIVSEQDPRRQGGDRPRPISMYPGMATDGAEFEALRLYRLAQEQSARGNLADAAARIDAALELVPQEPRFIALKAKVMFELSPIGEPPAATIYALLRQALQLDDACESAHDAMGRVLQSEGLDDEAYDHFRKAAVINPCNLYAVQRVLERQPQDSDTTRPSFWERLRRSIPPFGKTG